VGVGLWGRSGGYG